MTSVENIVILKPLLILFFSVAILQRFFLEAREHTKAHRGKVSVPWTGYVMVLFHAIVYSISLFDLIALDNTSPSNTNTTITLLGILLWTGGFLLRRWSINALGQFWSLQIELRKNQRLVKRGPYKYIRHPNYLAVVLEVIGVPLIINSLQVLAFVLLFYLPIIFYRLQAEEKVLITTFKNEYINYKRECKALIPNLTNLKRFSKQ